MSEQVIISIMFIPAVMILIAVIIECRNLGRSIDNDLPGVIINLSLFSLFLVGAIWVAGFMK